MMKASDFRKEARESLKGHKGKAGGTFLVYLFISFLLSLVLSFIPLIGPIFLYLLIPGILYGCITVLMRIKRTEDVSAFDCVGEGFSKFWKVFCANLWIFADIFVRGGLLYILGAVLMVSSNSRSFLDDAYSMEGAVENNGVALLGIIGSIIVFVSMIIIIVRSLRYSLVNFLIFDNPDLKAKEIVNKSSELMKENCGRIFCLNLSFIGWMLLLFLSVYVSAILISAGTFAMLFGGFSTMYLIGIIGYVVVGFISVFFLTPYMQMANICFYEELIGANKKEEEPMNNDFGNSINQNGDPISLI